MHKKTKQRSQKSVHCLVLNILFTFAIVCSTTFALPPFPITRITNNDYYDGEPQISGNNVVWTGVDPNGSDAEIFFWDGNSITQITHNDETDEQPQISGNNVVWQYGYGTGFAEIFFWDGNSITQITDDMEHDFTPQISGNNVVWQHYDNDYEIFFWNGSSTTQVTDNGYDDSNPQISGNNVVWQGNSKGGEMGYELFFWDGDMTIQVTDNNDLDCAAQISGNNVVWIAAQDYLPMAGGPINPELFFWDGTTMTQLTNEASAIGFSNSDPQISGNNVAWQRWLPIFYENQVFFWDGTDITQITENNYPVAYEDYECPPQISGNTVVWHGWDGNDYEIYLWDGRTIIQITDNDYEDKYPQISGEHVVWQGYYPYPEIFYARLIPIGYIQGKKWHDANNNHIQDTGEQGLAGWRIYADLNENGQFDSNEPNDITDANGDYQLTVVTGAPAIVTAEEPKNCWVQTYPSREGTYTVSFIPGEIIENINFGNARPTEIHPSAWKQDTQYKLLAADGVSGDSYGESVSISDDYALIGMPKDDEHGTDSGAAYLYTPSDVNCGQWNQVVKLTASDGGINQKFGQSVSINGDYAIIGAPYDNDNGSNSGSAYIFCRNEGGPDNWGLQAKLIASDGAEMDQFAFSVSLHGDYAIIGTLGDDDKGDGSGSAYIFYRYESGLDNWGQQAKLTADDGEAGDNFGISVSIDGAYAIVGANGDDDNEDDSGSAYIFKRDGSTWSQQDKLTASDGDLEDLFGTSVSISGNFAISGAYYDDTGSVNSGSAYIFMRDGSNWTQQAKLIASDAAPSDLFGRSVSIRGDCAIVGAFYGNVEGSASGSAYIFEYDGFNWNEKTKLIASDGAAYDYYGHTVSIAGAHAIIGAYGDDDKGSYSGSAYIYGKALCPTMDLTGDCFVGLDDLAVFAGQWLQGAQ